MRRVTVMSRRQAEDVVWHMNGPLISIANSKGDSPNIDYDFWTAVYSLCFDDITRPEDGLRMFDKIHVDYVNELVSRLFDFDDIYIHCEAGISRSVALGMWFAEKHDRILVLSAAASTIGYNVHVYNMLKHKEANERIQAAFTDL